MVHTIRGPLADHVARLGRAEGLIFFYPTWFFGQPAILKGWFDRVWLPGVAFTIPEEGGLAQSCLQRIRLLGTVTTTGMPWVVLQLLGFPGQRVIKRCSHEVSVRTHTRRPEPQARDLGRLPPALVGSPVMAGRTIFNFRVLRCPSCSATLPVRAGDVMVTCEYCDAGVQVSRSKAPSAAPTPPPRSPSARAHAPAPVLTAKPHASIFAWLLSALVFITSLGGVLFAFVATSVDSTGAGQAGPPPQVVATPPRAAHLPQEPSGELGGAAAEEPTDPSRPVPPATETEAETKSKSKSKNKSKSKAASPREPKLPEPTGPVLSVSDAQKAIKGDILACMREQGVHDILAYMGNSKVGAVSVLGDSRTRMDGVRKRIKGTKLGACMNRAGATIRARAFKSNYLRFSLVLDELPDPLGHLPEKSDRAEIDRIIATADPQVLECAKKHGEEGAKEIFMFTIDGPSGEPLSVSAGYRGRAFKRCAEPIYKKLRFPKVREWTIKVTKHLQM